ncbi:cytochrome P450 [Daedaleopsis nitida]|nr:cytochrome P450 [Daedaleopsis nitida]
MENSSSVLYAALGLTLASVLAYRSISKSSYPAPLPPGPKPLPVIGNVADLPKLRPWETFARWGDIYGGITHVSALGQHIVVLNDAKYALDMLDKKGLLYSDRPTLVMGGQIVGWDEGPALSPFCDRWAEYRRLFSHFMGTKAKIDAFDHVLHEETNVFLKHLLAEPDDWVEHTRRYAARGGLVLQLAYGYKASDPGGKELVKLVDDAMFGFSETTKANAFLVDVFPILRYVPAWFPGAGWKHKAKEYHDYLEEMLRAPFDLVKRQMATGVARSSFTQAHLDGQKHTAEKERIIQWAAAGIYSGTSSPALTPHLPTRITRHTDEQKKAQAEIDAVVGRDRLPTFADRERLPYCEALCLEIMRYYTFGPLGLAHVPREDDVHEGYFIPKGTIVIPNNWRFFKDPKTYPNPEVFTPERFMGEEKQFDPRKYLFGYGRIHLADASMWLACVSVLAAFDVVPPVKNGKPVVPSGRFMDGGISHPEPFECTIKPRSASTEALVNALPTV